MDFTKFTTNLKTIKLQRNYALCVNIFFACLIVMLLLVILTKADQHTTIVVPADLKSPVSISQNNVDDSYLIQWTEFIASLKLNLTPETVAYKQNSLLSYVSAEKYGAFKLHLISEQEEIKNNEMSMVFYPKEVNVLDRKELQTEVTGLMRVYVGDQLNSTVQAKYHLSFAYVTGKLLLKSFKEVSREE